MKVRYRTEHFERAECWCQALRSGKYEQGTDRLRTVDGHGFNPTFTYCVLGVGNECSGQGYWQGSRYMTTQALLQTSSEVDWDARIHKYYGLDPRLSDILIGLNDNEDYTFDELATVIEEMYGLIRNGERIMTWAEAKTKSQGKARGSKVDLTDFILSLSQNIV